MIEVRGIHGYRFDERVTGSLDNVITPPFDVISPRQRVELAARSAFNMTHVILPEPEGSLDRYQAAAARLDQWIVKGAMKRDSAETFYLLEQVFPGLDGKEHVRRGFLGRARIPEFGEDLILDHERTFTSKVADRMRLTVATRANLGAVFVLYQDGEHELAGFLGQMGARPPDFTAKTIDGVTQRVWVAPYDPAVTAFLRKRRLYIADGHHRFRTAREYRDRMRLEAPGDGTEGYDYVLMGFVALEDPGLRVWPTHRLLDVPAGFDLKSLVPRLSELFYVSPVEGNLGEALGATEGCAFGMAVRDGGHYLLRLKPVDRIELLGNDRTDAWRALDVAVLHRCVIERILGFGQDTELAYDPNADSTIAAIASGEKDLAFLVKATRTSQIVACAEAHDPMPEKATYFFPKLPSGAVIYKHE